MVLLGRVERAGGDDLRGDGLAVLGLFLRLRPSVSDERPPRRAASHRELLGGDALGIRVVEDGRAVLRANVVALAGRTSQEIDEPAHSNRFTCVGSCFL